MANNRSTWNRGKGYELDSAFEDELKAGALKDYEYHPKRIPYVEYSNYYPDWVIHEDKGNLIYIEAKGVLRESSECKKYKAIRDGLSKDEELVFIFQYPHKKRAYDKRPRKDGTYLSHAEWAKKEGFRWFTKDTIQEIL